MPKRKVCILTGSRADYGLLKPVIKAVAGHPDLEYGLIVTGMHLSAHHNFSAQVIENDGWNIYAKIPLPAEEGTNLAMAKDIAVGIDKMSTVFKDIEPTFFLVLGDRYEALAGVIAAAYMNVIVAHIHGGDKTAGGLDESARHAMTKFAHLHFPATKLSAERVRKMGEDDWRIHTVGSPAIDNIVGYEYPSREAVLQKFGLADEPYLVLIQHPVSTQAELANEQIKATLEAISELGIQTVAMHPNTDAGYREITLALEKAQRPKFKVYANLPQHLDYLSLIKYAGALVGNSSGGMTEVASFKVPVVNIGDRQKGRECGGNVIDTPHDKLQIKSAVTKALHDQNFRKQVERCVNPYGDGKAGVRIAEILAKTEISHQILQKQISY